MNEPRNHYLLLDGRWSGMGGIGRFSDEVLKRLPSGALVLKGGPKPTNPFGALWVEWWLHKYSPKVFFTPGFSPAPSKTVASLCVIHDLIHLRCRGERNVLKTYYYANIIAPAVHRTGRVVTVSQFSQCELAEWLHLSLDRIAVAYNAVGPEFSPQGTRWKPGFEYALYVGNQRPHKNVSRLIGAISRLSYARDLHLVVPGAATAEVRNAVQHFHLMHRVHFLGRIAESSLPAVYRGAQILVMPSLYEGFGLPVLEAMACGIPVASSNRASLPEVAGDAALFFDPEDLDAMAEAIDRLVTDSGLRALLSEKGFKRCQAFSWQRTADLVLETIQAVHEERS